MVKILRRRGRLAYDLLAAVALYPMLTSPLLAAPGDRSPDGVWEEVDPSVLDDVTAPLPTAFRAYRLDVAALLEILRTAPPEDLGGPPVPAGRGGVRRSAATAALLSLPLPGGGYAETSVEESPILAPDLAAAYPDIKTYVVRETMNGPISGRLTLGPGEFQALLTTPAGALRIAHFRTPTETIHLSFLNRHRTDGADMFMHPPDEQVDPNDRVPASGAEIGQIGVLAAQTGPTLRQYRLAASATGEYYQARLGPNGITDVVNSIVAEINNANALFEPELAIRLLLQFVIVWLDPTTDPYSTVDGTTVTVCDTRDENVAATNSVISPNDYDIGYVFNTGGGNGCAWYVLCLADKARGAGLINTANVPPGGSTGLLAHEMGHQFGARHTFSGTGCPAGEFNQPSAYEPGSGTTIMSYLGSCGADDVVVTSALPAGMYYDTRSFEEIVDNVTFGSGASCGTSLATGNSAPVVDAGADYTIPRGTPFTLTGSASDPDADPLTYAWEQFDVAASQRAIDTDTGEGPLFRSVQPGTDPSRTFPTLSDILNNIQTPGEVLPSMDRTLTFRLTARDDRPGGGGVASDTALLTVAGDPFFLTSPNGGETFGAGCSAPVTWSVGGGGVAAEVGLQFSEDGGQSFATIVAATPNDGAAPGLLPCATTGQARMKAAAVGNVFFDVSDGNFTVVPTPPAVSVAAAGGEVDENCEFLVTFSATVADDCGVDAGDVSVQASKLMNNFTLGPVTFNAVQVDPVTVSVTGSVLVTDVFNSPATLTIEVTGPDACGAAASDSVSVQVSDTTPPEIAVDLQPDMLWPPNHRLKDVVALVTVMDNCPNVSFVLSSVTSDEPDNGRGDGNTTNDIQGAGVGTPDTLFKLRAERAGTGDGRDYTAVYTATDASSNQASASDVVRVPHGRK